MLASRQLGDPAGRLREVHGKAVPTDRAEHRVLDVDTHTGLEHSRVVGDERRMAAHRKIRRGDDRTTDIGFGQDAFHFVAGPAANTPPSTADQVVVVLARRLHRGDEARGRRRDRCARAARSPTPTIRSSSVAATKIQASSGAVEAVQRTETVLLGVGRPERRLALVRHCVVGVRVQVAADRRGRERTGLHRYGADA